MKKSKALKITAIIAFSLVVVLGLGVLVDELVWLEIDKKHFSFIEYPWNKSDDSYEFGIVMVYVKEKYRESYEQKGFTVEDFAWNNVEKIEYRPYWYENEQFRFLRILVYLKKPGSKNCRRACVHFNKLDFVRKTTAYGEVVI